MILFTAFLWINDGGPGCWFLRHILRTFASDWTVIRLAKFLAIPLLIIVLFNVGVYVANNRGNSAQPSVGPSDQARAIHLKSDLRRIERAIRSEAIAAPKTPPVDRDGTNVSAECTTTYEGQKLPCDAARRLADIDREVASIGSDGISEDDPDLRRLLREYGSGSDPDLSTYGPNGSSSGSTSHYGELNEAGFPKNQYVRPYTRKDGTHVDGYYRNSPSDSLPTCHYISC